MGVEVVSLFNVFFFFTRASLNLQFLSFPMGPGVLYSNRITKYIFKPPTEVPNADILQKKVANSKIG